MKKDEIKVGGLYTARVSGRFVTVRVDRIYQRGAFGQMGRETTCYDVTNLATGRKTTFRSAAKFRSEVPPERTAIAKELEDAKAAFDARAQEAIETAPQEEAGDSDKNSIAYQIGRNDCGKGVRRNDNPFDMSERPDQFRQWAKGWMDAREASEGADPTSDALSTTPPAQPVVPCGATDAAEGEQRADPTDQPPHQSLAQSAVATAATAAAPTTALTSLAARLAAANATPRGIVLTAEQAWGLAEAQRVEAMRGNGQRVLVLKAGAGSGKTFELQQLEKVLQGNGQYTAYNASLVADSKPKFKKAFCNTTHSLAFRAVGKRYAHRLNGPRVRSGEIAARLGIGDYNVALPESVAPADVDTETGERKPQLRRLKAAWLAGQVTEAIRKFCQSADPEITARHFACIPGIDEAGKYTNSDKVKAYLLPFARKAWDDLADPSGSLPFQHDVYVKLWSMGTGPDRPVIAADYIMLDEYQDTAPVMVAILKHQVHAVLVLVGDDNQRIYEWRGAINAGDEFPDAPRCNLSKSFRFGQVIADVANAVLARLDEPTDLVMRGFEAIPSRVCRVERPRCYLYRTNAGAIGKLMQAMDEGRRGHLIGGSKEVVAFCRAALDLQAGQSTIHPELGCFSKWCEVQEYVKEAEGADLRLMVKLIDDFGADRIIAALEDMPPEDKADLVISTAHRSKGREWASVKLGADFPLPNKMGDAECRLVYVAATRAQEELDISECPTFCGGWDKQGGGEGGEAQWIPGIEVAYTVPMPTAEELDAYRAAKAAVRGGGTPSAPTPAEVPPPVAAPPAPVPAPANGNGGGFTWASVDGKWCVRGPAECTGELVTVTRKDGSTAKVTLRAVVKKLGDLWFYSVR